LKFYNCTVAVETDVGGRPLLTVQRPNVSEFELKLLRGIHGHARVLDVKPAGEVASDEDAVRLEHLRLARRYGDGGGFFDGSNHGVVMVARHLGVELHDFDTWLADTQENEERERQERLQASQQRFNQESSAGKLIEALTALTAKTEAPAAGKKQHKASVE